MASINESDIIIFGASNLSDKGFILDTKEEYFTKIGTAVAITVTIEIEKK